MSALDDLLATISAIEIIEKIPKFIRSALVLIDLRFNNDKMCFLDCGRTYFLSDSWPNTFITWTFTHSENKHVYHSIRMNIYS